MTVQISDFLSAVHGRLEGVRAARKVYASRLAPGFNVMSLLRADELRLSAVLAELLSPEGSHSQGRKFWDLFVHHFDLPVWAAQAHDVRVGIEVATDRAFGAEQRRIDVLINLDGGKFGIAIENKPWAADQRKQITDYLAHLGACYPGGHLLIYLAGTDRIPDVTSISEVERVAAIEAGRLTLGSFEKLLPWLSACRQQCEAQIVVSFLTEFEHYIRAEFIGVKDMVERNALIDVATRSEDSTEAALAIVFAGADIQEHLMRMLVSQLEAKVSAGGYSWELSSDKKFSDAYKGFFFRFGPEDPCTIRFQFEQRGYRDFFCGVSKDKLAPDLEAVRVALNQEFNSARLKADHWVWWEWITEVTDWSNSTTPWKRIVSGEMAAEIFYVTEKIYRRLSSENLLGHLRGLVQVAGETQP